MDSFTDKVAVITGGASGMGKAFAQRFGSAGAKVVVSDVEGPALDATVAELAAAGIDAMGVVADVSSEADMDRLAEQTFAAHDQVNLVFLNAGVGGGGPLAGVKAKDWQWVVGVNLFGVAYGLERFLPHLLEHGDGHIVTTASVAGHTAYPGMGIYNATKHAVVALSETLYRELQAAESSVGVSVLCPGLVKTNILDSARNRPESLTAAGVPPERTDEEEQMMQVVRDIYGQAMGAEEVADIVHDAVVANQFYIWTDRVYADAIAARHDDIQNTRNPSPAPHLLEADQSKRL